MLTFYLLPDCFYLLCFFCFIFFYSISFFYYQLCFVRLSELYFSLILYTNYCTFDKILKNFILIFFSVLMIFYALTAQVHRFLEKWNSFVFVVFLKYNLVIFFFFTFHFSYIQIFSIAFAVSITANVYQLGIRTGKNGSLILFNLIIVITNDFSCCRTTLFIRLECFTVPLSYLV